MIHVKVFTFSAIQENTYVLYNDDHKAIIIDPGCYSNEEQETLKKFIKDTHLEPIQLLNTQYIQPNTTLRDIPDAKPVSG